jgi:small-conductance mechanosensitive channel
MEEIVKLGDMSLILPLAMLLVGLLVLLTIRNVILRLAQKWARSTNTRMDDILVASLKAPSLFWCCAIGLYLGLKFSELPARVVQPLSTLMYVILVVSVTLALANLSGRLFRNYLQSSNLPIPTSGLAYGILKGSIYVAGFLTVLSVLGISIAPLLTALGVGGLAVALALQDTLANLFAGVHILMEKSIRVGDFIRLESGQEGFVEDITWRTTRVRMLPNNMVIIPNSTLSKSTVTNYSLPEKRMSLLVAVGVSYDCDPDRVERLLVEEAMAAAGQVPGLREEPPPFVRFIPGFGDSSLDFTLICQVDEFVDQYLAQHELRKRIFRRFRDEGIEIPFPQRTVHIRTTAGAPSPVRGS